MLDMVRLYNLAPNLASNDCKTPFEQLFLHDICYPLQFNNELEKDFESTFVVGEKVFLKPANGKCDSEFSSQTMDGADLLPQLDLNVLMVNPVIQKSMLLQMLDHGVQLGLDCGQDVLMIMLPNFW